MRTAKDVLILLGFAAAEVIIPIILIAILTLPAYGLCLATGCS